MTAEARADYTAWLWEQEEARREAAAEKANGWSGGVPVAVVNAHARKLREQQR